MNGARNVAALLRLRRWSALPLAIVLICGAAAPGLGANGDGRPIELAVFDFELDDYSAGTSIAGDRDGDEVQLASVSSEVRKVIEQSRRYRLVDVSSTDALAAKDHSLRSCDGCDASIALALGAEQSLVGVVRRITRTEYVVQFRLRDARTGELLASQETDLRMGANYAWSRGATRLIRTACSTFRASYQARLWALPWRASNRSRMCRSRFPESSQPRRA